MTRTFFRLIALGMCLSGAAMATSSTETQAVAVIHAEWKPVVKGISLLAEAQRCGAIGRAQAHAVAESLASAFQAVEVQQGLPSGVPQASAVLSDAWSLGDALASGPGACAKLFSDSDSRAIFAHNVGLVEAMPPAQVLEAFGG